MDALDFWLAVVEYRRRLPCSVTSWGRDPVHNHAVGGASNSKHLDDRAVDVVYPADVPITHRIDTARTLGLILRAESDHDHLEAPD
jgi:hypothetical protein